MRSSESASITSSASRASRLWVPSQREYRKLAGMGLLTTLHLVTGLHVDYGDPRPDEFLELGGSAVEHRKRGEVHRDHGLDTEQLHSLGGTPRPHCVEVADREEAHLGLLQLAGEHHVSENVRPSGEVGPEAVFNVDELDRRLTAVAVVRSL